MAFDRPKPPSAPAPAFAAARLMNQTSSSTSRMVGPKPTSSCCQTGAGASGGFAFTGTLFACNWASRLSAANDGRWVVNRSTDSAFVAPVGVYETFLVKVPSMVSPVEVISATFLAVTCVTKYVYETAVRAGGDSRNDETIQLSASTTSRIQPKRSHIGRGFFGPSGPSPAGCGAPSTFHGGGVVPRLSSFVRFGGRIRASGPAPFGSGPGVVMEERYPSGWA